MYVNAIGYSCDGGTVNGVTVYAGTGGTLGTGGTPGNVNARAKLPPGTTGNGTPGTPGTLGTAVNGTPGNGNT